MTAAMTERHFHALGPHGFHKIAYTQWGAAHNRRVAVCVHGLTRNGRDFDFLAEVLAADYRVVCPDVAGRGRSDWLIHPEDYGYPLYLSDMAALLARTGADEVDWIGTSMGGLIGMMLAAQPGSPIRRLVVNDVGAHLPKVALERIAGYVALTPRFETLAEVEDHLRRVHAPFGPLTDAQWAHLARYAVRKGADGGFVFHYDPAIADAFKGPIEDVDLWEVWRRVRCPVLVIRGARSDLLTADVAERMLTEGPDTTLIEIADTGHAPALMAPEQTKAVRDWLMK